MDCFCAPELLSPGPLSSLIHFLVETAFSASNAAAAVVIFRKFSLGVQGVFWFHAPKAIFRAILALNLALWTVWFAKKLADPTTDGMIEIFGGFLQYLRGENC